MDTLSPEKRSAYPLPQTSCDGMRIVTWLAKIEWALGWIFWQSIIFHLSEYPPNHQGLSIFALLNSEPVFKVVWHCIQTWQPFSSQLRNRSPYGPLPVFWCLRTIGLRISPYQKLSKLRSEKVAPLFCNFLSWNRVRERSNIYISLSVLITDKEPVGS